MRHAAEFSDETLTIELVDEVKVAAAFIDGGGIEIADIDSLTGNPPVYEVHGQYTDGEFLCIPQDQILRVVTSSGEEVEFGNPFMPGHPRHGEYTL